MTHFTCSLVAEAAAAAAAMTRNLGDKTHFPFQPSWIFSMAYPITKTCPLWEFSKIQMIENQLFYICGRRLCNMQQLSTESRTASAQLHVPQGDESQHEVVRISPRS